MIIISIISGPHSGKSREVRDGVFDGVTIHPVPLLTQLFQLGSRWEIDWSRATDDELLDWGRADMTVRYLRALVEGRSVFFMGTEYYASSADEAMQVAQQVEDAVSTSGYYVVLEYDDERGVSIGTRQTEHRTQ